jgi:hypothetical protein
MPLTAITTACHLIRWFCTLTPQSGHSLLRPPAKRPSVARYRPNQGFHFGSAWKTLGGQVHQSGLGCISAGRRHLRSLPSVTSTTRSICEPPVLALVCVRGDTQGKPIKDCRVRLSRPSSTARHDRLRALGLLVRPRTTHWWLSRCTTSARRHRHARGSGRRCVVTCSSRHCRRGVRRSSGGVAQRARGSRCVGNAGVLAKLFSCRGLGAQPRARRGRGGCVVALGVGCPRRGSAHTCA